MRTRMLEAIGMAAAVLVAAPGAAAVLVAAPGAAAVGAYDAAPAAICATYADAIFHGPNWVVGVDTSAYERAGWGCELKGVAAGGTWTAELVRNDSRTNRFRRLCASTGGTFYVFDRVLGPGPEHTVFVVVGCSRI